MRHLWFLVYLAVAIFLLVCGCNRVQDSPVEDVVNIREFGNGFKVWRFDHDGIRYTAMDRHNTGIVILKTESIVPGARHDLPAER